MSIEIDVLSEVYTILKQHIPQKDRQEAADSLMSVMVDLLSDDELKEFSGTDSSLNRAYKEYVADFDEDSDEYYEDE
jgi:uncharacterized protein YecT (DUF1311 family)